MSDDSKKVVLDRADLESALLKHHTDIEKTLEKMQGQVDDSGSVASELKAEVEAHAEKAQQIGDRLAELEQKYSDAPAGEEGPVTIGEEFTKSDTYEALVKGRANTGRIDIENSLGKTAIINATGQNQPLVQSDRQPGYNPLPNRRFTIRDLVPQLRTSSNLVEYVRESGFDNQAGPQISAGSPEQFENVPKAESGITFTLEQEAVQTIAHWIPASRQVLSDAPALQGYINGRLMYGLKLKEETELLVGPGTGGRINGLITQATPYVSQGLTDAVTTMDTLREAVLQAELTEYTVTGFVLNPVDWAQMEVQKVNAGTDDRYIVGDPRNRMGATLWGLPVVATNSIAAGTFLTGAFDMGATIWDRWDMAVEVSREHDDFFTKNMVAILCEERLAMTVNRTEAFVAGSFS